MIMIMILLSIMDERIYHWERMIGQLKRYVLIFKGGTKY